MIQAPNLPRGLVTVEPGEGTQIGFLHGVLRRIAVAQHAARDAEQPAIVAAHQRFEGHQIAWPRALHQPVVRAGPASERQPCGTFGEVGIGK